MELKAAASSLANDESQIPEVGDTSSPVLWEDTLQKPYEDVSDVIPPPTVSKSSECSVFEDDLDFDDESSFLSFIGNHTDSTSINLEYEEAGNFNCVSSQSSHDEHSYSYGDDSLKSVEPPLLLHSHRVRCVSDDIVSDCISDADSLSMASITLSDGSIFEEKTHCISDEDFEDIDQEVISVIIDRNRKRLRECMIQTELSRSKLYLLRKMRRTEVSRTRLHCWKDSERSVRDIAH